MGFAVDADVPWPVPPDWTEPVRETLGWLTDELRASATAVRQKRELRSAPERTFSFRVLVDRARRQLLEAARFDVGARTWQLPIWHDMQLLAGDVAAAADEVPCITVGYEFEVGGKVLLWRSPTQFEIAVIESIASDALTLTDPLAAGWAKGTRLYPLRIARLLAPPEETFKSDDVSAYRVDFILQEPCDWTATLPDTLYRGNPVLVERPSEPQDWTASWLRRLLEVEDPTGFTYTADPSGRAFRTQMTQWQIVGREAHGEFRSLLYGLRGRMAGVWLPSWSNDLYLAAAAAAAATTISVDWCGYSVFGRQQEGRRDIRIELVDGTVIMRRITGSVEAGATETLTLDAALGVDITLATVRRIAFMAFCQQMSDVVEILHQTDADGSTRCDLAFEMTDEF